MRDDDKYRPNARRIRAFADILQDVYLQTCERGDWLGNLCAVIVFVDLVIAEIEVSALELNDWSPLPGEVRKLVLSMLKNGLQEA